MIKENPNRRDCIEQMKVLIKDDKEDKYIIKKCIADFKGKGVHDSTFYDWLPIAKKELTEDIDWLDKQSIINSQHYEDAQLKKQLKKDAKDDYRSCSEELTEAKVMSIKLRVALRKEINSYLKAY
tara:strand:- start:15 stop:389 length:375 start_codon:yes stop_codon:yes gene_type:complete